jgi:hypothetical protein
MRGRREWTGAIGGKKEKRRTLRGKENEINIDL